MIISGPSGSGKTTFLMRFLKETQSLINPPPKSILYCYSEYHDNNVYNVFDPGYISKERKSCKK